MHIDYPTLVRMILNVRLIDFYPGLRDGTGRSLSVTLSMGKTSDISSALAGSKPLQGRWIEGWVKERLEAAGTLRSLL
jgi:hypothetical protein